MKQVLGLLIFCLMVFSSNGQKAAQYHVAEQQMMTTWGEQIDPTHVWEVYPRPIMQRPDWKSLNGLWQYAILPRGEAQPQQWQGQILVPFCPESALSGVGRKVGDGYELWYERQFAIPTEWRNRNVLLNFDAVDWKCDIWVNDIKIGSHTGGFTAFSLDITAALRRGQNTLLVRVWDPTDLGTQPRGKQVVNPHSCWYTAVTGIWQSVWLEPVNPLHFCQIRTTPDLSSCNINIRANSTATDGQTITRVRIFDAGSMIAEGSSIGSQDVDIRMPRDTKLWTPDQPHCYDMEVSLLQNGQVVDQISSYVAMRQISRGRDGDGIERLLLNGEPLFQFGPLDQGWWPDGLLTPPSYEAMIYDLEQTKSWGFNMIRKHIKVEPATWYTWCDRNGIIVWQDMPSGDAEWEWQNHKYFDGVELNRTPESEYHYRKEWREIMDQLHSYPCICVWVPFNERWGQFKTVEITSWTQQHDPSRLVNSASGGNFFPCGDILDLHNYPEPRMYLFDGSRVNVLGEYGGIGYPISGHLWAPERQNWGYVQYNSPTAVTDVYVDYAEQLYRLAQRGFSAAVYTQTTDVEIEVNGFMTYDRKLFKMELDRVRQANRKLVEMSFPK